MGGEHDTLGIGQYGPFGVCPLMGRACPGPEQCAPAKMTAGMLSAGRDDGDKPVEPVCPVALVTEAASHAAAGLSYLALGPPEPPATDVPETPGERRRRILKDSYGLGPDDR